MYPYKKDKLIFKVISKKYGGTKTYSICKLILNMEQLTEVDFKRLETKRETIIWTRTDLNKNCVNTIGVR